ncbi:MAG: glycosyltransferase [Proteobacteria bacterium]|nr:glycosyltransferase [Pseudomonadota bacterium]
MPTNTSIQNFSVERWWFTDTEQPAAQGSDYVLVQTPQAKLEPSSVGQLVSVAGLENADIVYGDEYVASLRGPNSPRFKPGFNPDLLRACDYIGDSILIRRSMLLDHLRQHGCESVYDLCCRCFAQNGRIAHARNAWVSYGRLRSQALNSSKKQVSAALNIYQDHNELTEQSQGVQASIIIPTRDRLDLLKQCIESVYLDPGSVSFEVIVVDNGSVEPATLDWLASAPTRFDALKVVRDDGEFNWSRLNNTGRKHAQGQVGIYLNNDIEDFSSGWLEALVERALRPDTGVVGVLLRYPDLTIQHAGVVVGIGRFADHVYCGAPLKADDGHMFVDPLLPRNVLACTGACIALSFTKYDEVGGFDEGLVICGDVAICIALHRLGYRNLYDPAIQALHLESATRPREALGQQEIERLMPYIETFVREGDPFYHPDLDLRGRYPTFDRTQRPPDNRRIRG